MINFFRKTRKKMADDNRPLKYMRYAIGEIVLVVIGILIALQINNWNETRKLRKVEHQYYTDILEDLKKDTIRLNRDIKALGKQINDIEVAFQTLNLPDLNDNQIDTIISKTDYTARAFIPNTITMDDIVSSGKTGILNPEIKKKLFVLSTLQREIINAQNINNEDVIWHIKQFESASDYSYPKLKKIRYTEAPRFNPELLKKYTNVLAKKYEKSVDHINYYKYLHDITSEVIKVIENKISVDL